jgi:hypothetical protein
VKNIAAPKCIFLSKPQLTKLVGQPPDEPEWLH